MKNPGLSPKAWDKLHKIMSEINRRLAAQKVQEKKGA